VKRLVFMLVVTCVLTSSLIYLLPSNVLMLLLVTLKALLSVLLVRLKVAPLGLRLMLNVLFVLVISLLTSAVKGNKSSLGAIRKALAEVAFLRPSVKTSRAERPPLHGSVQQDDRSNNNT
jgi:hypothetical protein